MYSFIVKFIFVHMMDRIDQIVKLTGLFFILYIVFYFLIGCLKFFKTFLNYLFPRSDFVKTYGKWAVVTGSSDGIGLAYARELARRGMNVVLMSYAKEQLLEAAKQIESEFKVETKAMVVDFSDGIQIYEKIGDELKTLDVGILVNNVGVALPSSMRFDEMTEKQIWDHVSVNILAGTMMTKKLLPDMKKRKRGAIVNVASASALVPSPYISVYSGTKIYVSFFSRALRVECKGSGVTVQTLVPYFVDTNLLKNSPQMRQNRLTVPTAEGYVKHAICTLGATDFTTGFLSHGVLAFFFSLVPDRVYDFFALRISKGIREEYLKTISETKKPK